MRLLVWRQGSEFPLLAEDKNPSFKSNMPANIVWYGNTWYFCILWNTILSYAKIWLVCPTLKSLQFLILYFFSLKTLTKSFTKMDKICLNFWDALMTKVFKSLMLALKPKWVFTPAVYAGGSGWRRWSRPCRSQSPRPSSTSSPASSSSSSFSSSSWWASPTATGSVRAGQSLAMLSMSNWAWVGGWRCWRWRMCKQNVNHVYQKRGKYSTKLKTKTLVYLFLFQEAKKLGLYCSWNEYLSQLRDAFYLFHSICAAHFQRRYSIHTILFTFLVFRCDSISSTYPVSWSERSKICFDLKLSRAIACF